MRDDGDGRGLKMMYACVERRRGGLWLMGKLPSAAVRGVCRGLGLMCVRRGEEKRVLKMVTWRRR